VLGAPQPNWAHAAVGAAVSLAIFLIGLTVFRTSEPRFADTI
jgi:ABC-type polysaccharide/polyol phosphate export permease